MTLYQQVLGAEFDTLPPLLRRFHSEERGGRGSGEFTVVRGTGVLRSTLARLMRLPRPGQKIETRLEIRVESEQEMWMRRFGEQTIETLQWRSGGLLMERAGPMIFAFRLCGSSEGMRFEWEQTRLLGLRLPRWLAVRINAEVRCTDEDCWHVEVRIALPLLGVVTQYHGTLAPLP